MIKAGLHPRKSLTPSSSSALPRTVCDRLFHLSLHFHPFCERPSPHPFNHSPTHSSTSPCSARLLSPPSLRSASRSRSPHTRP
jgi:hypothetical protein